MRRGPKPKPESIRQLRGNTTKAAKKVAPRPLKLDDYAAPDHLPPRAVEKWDLLVAEFTRMDLITGIDLETLASYCTAYDQFVEACLHCNEEGYVIRGLNGPVRNPWAIAAKQATDTMLQIGSLFGMSPADRMRLARPVNPSRSRNAPTGAIPDEDPLPRAPHVPGDNMGNFVASKPQAPGTKH